MTKRKSMSIWYPRYVGDYSRKTKHLSLVEHGAYALLLDWYYSNGKPLPLEWVHLHRICTAIAPSEQEAVHTVVLQFFTQTADGWRNATADEELVKRGNIKAVRQKAQRIREEKRTGAHAATPTPTPKKGLKTPLPPKGKAVDKAPGEGGFLNSGGEGVKRGGFNIEYKLSDSARDKAKAICRDLNRDFYNVMQEYNAWIAKKVPPDHPEGAFLAYCRKLKKL